MSILYQLRRTVTTRFGRGQGGKSVVRANIFAITTKREVRQIIIVS
jgi:hypothetical protein